MTAPAVVQWIERAPPKRQIQVRFLSEGPGTAIPPLCATCHRRPFGAFFHGFFIGESASGGFHGSAPAEGRKVRLLPQHVGAQVGEQVSELGAHFPASLFSRFPCPPLFAAGTPEQAETEDKNPHGCLRFVYPKRDNPHGCLRFARLKEKSLVNPRAPATPERRKPVSGRQDHRIQASGVQPTRYGRQLLQLVRQDAGLQVIERTHAYAGHTVLDRQPVGLMLQVAPGLQHAGHAVWR